jgi:hypothetical protein
MSKSKKMTSGQKGIVFTLEDEAVFDTALATIEYSMVP